MIRNCPLNAEDTVRANHIYGPARPLLQVGMKFHRNPSRNVPRIPLPTDISLHHRNIKLYIYFYMNITPFLNTKSSNINFLTEDNCI